MQKWSKLEAFARSRWLTLQHGPQNWKPGRFVPGGSWLLQKFTSNSHDIFEKGIHIPFISHLDFFLLTSTLLRIPPLVSTNINDTNEQDIAISFDRFHDSKAGLSTADRGELQASSLGMCDADDPNWKSNRQVPLAHGEDVSETDLRSLLHLNHLKLVDCTRARVANFARTNSDSATYSSRIQKLIRFRN